MRDGYPGFRFAPSGLQARNLDDYIDLSVLVALHKEGVLPHSKRSMGSGSVSDRRRA
jgi:hypothetical protein